MFTCPHRAMFILIQDGLTTKGCIFNGRSSGSIQTGRIFLYFSFLLSAHIHTHTYTVFICIYTHTYKVLHGGVVYYPTMHVHLSFLIKLGRGLCLNKLSCVFQNEAHS